ncbi:MAG TPA: hypothetical protein VM324_11180 [Egibacteraceae bacterium]|jgi:hypothetical protein|nr:hypothetical protein [Egibacteraceae bacterium]
MPAVATLLRGPRAEIGYLAYSVFVEDNRTFALALMIPSWDRELRVLRHESPFTAAALGMTTLVAWVHSDQSEPITPVVPMGQLQNLHRSVVAVARRVSDPELLTRAQRLARESPPPPTGAPTRAQLLAALPDV